MMGKEKKERRAPEPGKHIHKPRGHKPLLVLPTSPVSLLKFPICVCLSLKEIAGIVNDRCFDRDKALEQQIELLTLKKERATQAQAAPAIYGYIVSAFIK